MTKSQIAQVVVLGLLVAPFGIFIGSCTGYLITGSHVGSWFGIAIAVALGFSMAANTVQKQEAKRNWNQFWASGGPDDRN